MNITIVRHSGVIRCCRVHDRHCWPCDNIAFVPDWSDLLFYKSLPVKVFMYEGGLTNMSDSGMNHKKNDS